MLIQIQTKGGNLIINSDNISLIQPASTTDKTFIKHTDGTDTVLDVPFAALAAQIQAMQQRNLVRGQPQF